MGVLRRAALCWTVLRWGKFLSLQSPRDPFSSDGPVTRLMLVRLSKRRLLEDLWSVRAERDRLRRQLHRGRYD